MSKLFWRIYAHFYDRLLRFPPYTDHLDRIVALVTERVPKRHKTGRWAGMSLQVADVGCGTGALLVRLNEAGYLSCGWDKSAAMMRRVEAKLPWPWHTSTRDVETITIANGWGDCFICVNTLYTINDPAAVLRKLYQALKPGGWLILSEPWRFPTWRELWHDYGSVKVLWDLWPVILCNLWLMRKRKPEVHLQWVGRAKGAGFDVPKIHLIMDWEFGYLCDANEIVCAQKPK